MRPEPEAAISIARSIHPLLAGHHPFIQGMALADLLAIWLAGYEEELREALLVDHIAAVRELIPINEAMLRG